VKSLFCLAFGRDFPLTDCLFFDIGLSCFLPGFVFLLWSFKIDFREVSESAFVVRSGIVRSNSALGACAGTLSRSISMSESSRQSLLLVVAV